MGLGREGRERRVKEGKTNARSDWDTGLAGWLAGWLGSKVGPSRSAVGGGMGWNWDGSLEKGFRE